MFISGARCDKCKKWNYAERVLSKRELTTAFRKAGWTVGKRTICQDCKPKPKRVIIEE